MTSLFFSETKVGGWWGTFVCPRCEKTLTVANPSQDRRDWFTGSHRCDGTDWQGQR